MKIIIAALLGAALCGNAHGRSASGDDLNAFCETFNGSTDMDAGAAICFGYTSGISDNLPNNVCFPDGASNLFITYVFKLYLSDHPELHHMDASTLARDAFEEAFPCDHPFENLPKGA
jgi:hypothetical protein